MPNKIGASFAEDYGLVGVHLIVLENHRVSVSAERISPALDHYLGPNTANNTLAERSLRLAVSSTCTVRVMGNAPQITPIDLPQAPFRNLELKVEPSVVFLCICVKGSTNDRLQHHQF